ncbi:acyl-CoA dehydrogenase family protein [Streptomyces sp.]
MVSAVARGEPSTALVLTMTYLMHRGISRADSRWSLRLRDALYRSAVSDGALANSLRVEPALGSPARGGLPDTVARRVGDGWELSGHKLYTTGIPALRWLAVWARTDESEPRVGVFLVPREAHGIRVIESWDHLGLRASGSHDITFREVEVPEDNLVEIAAQGPGAQQDNRALAALHLPLNALYLGVARAAQRYFHRFAHERVPSNLGHPVAETERFRRAAGEIELLLDSAEQLVFGGAERVDAGDDSYTAEQALGTKVLAARHATTAVETAVRLLGNPGLSRANPLERHYRDIQCAPVHAPQDDIVLLALGKAALG